jgi:preprotein translocase subunit YajC
MGLFINNAWADTAASTAANSGGLMSGGESSYTFLIMTIAFIAIFYFLIIRPQSKRNKEHRQLIGNLAKGDEVLTNAGILGKIMKISDDFVVLQLADNLEIKIQKSAIASALPKGTIKSI